MENLLKYLRWRGEKAIGELADREFAAPQPSELQVNEYALDSVPEWTKLGLVTRADWLAQHLRARHDDLTRVEPAPVSAPERIILTPAPAAVAASAQVVPLSVAPVVPPAPPIDWGNIWSRAVEFVVSGALFRSLLYLGAFMIVVSAVVLAVVYWELFPPLLRIGLIIAVPLAFYLSGYLVRSRLDIPVAGTVITGIGATLVGVDFIAVYQLGGLQSLIDRDLYWLAASILSALIYILTATRIPHEFFGYISLIALSSTIIALTQVLRVPLEWGFATATAAGAVTVEIAGRAKLEERWNTIVAAAKNYPFMILPVMQLLVLAVPGNASVGRMGTFAFAALGYGLLTRRFPNVILVYASVLSSLAAGGFGLSAAALAWEWYAGVMATAAPLYISLPLVLKRGWQSVLLQHSTRVLNVTGFVLLGLAVILGTAALRASVWASVIALTIASLVLAGCARIFSRPFFVLIACALFVLPMSAATVRVLADVRVPQAYGWLMGAWSALATVYLGGGLALRAHEKYPHLASGCTIARAYRAYGSGIQLDPDRARMVRRADTRRPRWRAALLRHFRDPSRS